MRKSASVTAPVGSSYRASDQAHKSSPDRRASSTPVRTREDTSRPRCCIWPPGIAKSHSRAGHDTTDRAAPPAQALQARELRAAEVLTMSNEYAPIPDEPCTSSFATATFHRCAMFRHVKTMAETDTRHRSITQIYTSCDSSNAPGCSHGRLGNARKHFLSLYGSVLCRCAAMRAMPRGSRAAGSVAARMIQRRNATKSRCSRWKPR
jgi:hypothetical protein